jgi:hypothetical protein
MAGRGRTTFQKRQKEQLRLERRQQKAARKLERKAAKQLQQNAPDQDADAGLAAELGPHPFGE